MKSTPTATATLGESLRWLKHHNVTRFNKTTGSVALLGDTAATTLPLIAALAQPLTVSRTLTVDQSVLAAGTTLLALSVSHNGSYPLVGNIRCTALGPNGQKQTVEITPEQADSARVFGTGHSLLAAVTYRLRELQDAPVLA